MNHPLSASTLHLNPLDYGILFFYFGIVVVIGLLARRAVSTSADFFLSGRSLPAWITGLAFMSANLGALEILGNAANGAKYGVSAVHFYWLGAIPAMVILGIVLMPFYYNTGVHSVPEYLRRRFNAPTHFLNALIFAIAQVLIGGVNLFALALVMHSLLGWQLWMSIVVSAAFVLTYIILGGLFSAIYTEVLQFFVILAGLVPIVVIGLHQVGGFGGLYDRIADPAMFHTWQGTGLGNWTNPLGDWIGLAFGEGFVLSFGYWATNFAEVQRTLSAKDLSAARRTPIIAAFPKMFFPLLTIVPGMIALVLVPKLGKTGGPEYNDVIPELMGRLLPNGVLGIALTGLLAAFMAGMAANVSGFNAVFTYDLWKPYVVRDRDDQYYLKIGRIVTVTGIVISIGTAFIAAGYSNIQDYIQLLFSFFNSPLFTTFIIGLFWKRTTPWAAFSGLIAGTGAAAIAHWAAYSVAYFYPGGVLDPTGASINAQMQNFYSAIAAFLVDAVVMVAVSLATKPKPDSELAGLVWAFRQAPAASAAPEAQGSASGGSGTSTAVLTAPAPVARVRQNWWQSPVVLGTLAIALVVAMSLGLVIAY
jgi:SSS family solute:Na+ symporter